MRDLNLEAYIWYLFTSQCFFESAAKECASAAQWFGSIATSRQVGAFGKNSQIFDRLKSWEREFSDGAELASLGYYEKIWNTAGSVGMDVRGIMEQPLHSWMTEAEFREFETVRISRILALSSHIELALNNALAMDGDFDRDQDTSELDDEDSGFPGDEIVLMYEDLVDSYDPPLIQTLPKPLPEYVVDPSVTCRTGDEVPWTGVWFPSTGLENHSLTFAIKGQTMQPVYRVTKPASEFELEGFLLASPETVAKRADWHPVVPYSGLPTTRNELRAKAGEVCPKSGIWRPTDPGAVARTYIAGQTMAQIGSAYGITVWLWEVAR